MNQSSNVKATLKNIKNMPIKLINKWKFKMEIREKEYQIAKLVKFRTINKTIKFRTAIIKILFKKNIRLMKFYYHLFYNCLWKKSF